MGTEYNSNNARNLMPSSGKTLEEVKGVTPFAERWLKDNLHLTLSRNKTYIQPYYQGVKFTGSVVKRSRIYAGSKTVARFKEKVREINHKKDIIPTQACVYLNSYLGFMQQGRTYRIRRDMIARLSGRTLAELEPKNDYKKVLSREMLEAKNKKKSIKRYINKRRKYYKHRNYDTRRNKSKALDSRQQQSIPLFS